MADARGLNRRALALGAGVAFLAGCTRREDTTLPLRSFGPQLARLPPIAAGQARVVIVREDWQPGGGDVDVTIDGQRAGTMRDGEILARDVVPGSHQLDLARGGLFDDTIVQSLAVAPRAGQVAWVRLVHFIVDTTVAEPPGQARRGAASFQLNSTRRTSSFRFAEPSGPPR